MNRLAATTARTATFDDRSRDHSGHLAAAEAVEEAGSAVSRGVDAVRDTVKGTTRPAGEEQSPGDQGSPS